jgi:hypothetical protein
MTLLFATGCAVKYDFADTGASVLTGQITATYTVRGVPLVIDAGTMTDSGAFTLGGASGTLYTGVGDGLGVITIGLPQGGRQVTVGEGVVFHFDSAFVPERISLQRFGNGEDMRVFTDGILYADFYGTADMDSVIPLPPGITTLGLMTRGSLSDDSDFFISSIEGKRKSP